MTLRMARFLGAAVTGLCMVAAYGLLMPRDSVGLLDICSQQDQGSHSKKSVAPSAVSAPSALSAPPSPSTSAVRVSVDAPDNLPLSVQLGDWIDLDVVSTRAGVVTVHGLAGDEYRIPGTGVVRVRFQATQLGRYPVHFHSAEGEHVPLAYIDVLPN